MKMLSALSEWASAQLLKKIYNIRIRENKILTKSVHESGLFQHFSFDEKWLLVRSRYENIIFVVFRRTKLGLNFIYGVLRARRTPFSHHEFGTPFR